MGFPYPGMKLCHFDKVYIVVYYIREFTVCHEVCSGENPAAPA